MDSVSEVRLEDIFPELARRIRLLSVQLASENIYIRVTQALRTVAEQDALYAIGRSTIGKRVTNCPGGLSYHNFGLGVDCVPSTHGPDKPYDPDWNNTHPTWIRMEQAAQELGLNIGALWRTFPDAPHFQLTGRFPEGKPSPELQELFKNGGYPAVWDAVRASLQIVVK